MSIAPQIIDPEVLAEQEADEARYVAALEQREADRESAAERRREAVVERRLRGPGW